MDLFCGFFGMIPLAVFFRLPLPNYYPKVCLPYSLQLSYNSLNHHHFLQYLVQQIPTSQHPGFVQLVQYNYAEMEMQFSQKLVHVHRIHIFDQYLQKMEHLLVLKQPSCNCF